MTVVGTKASADGVMGRGLGWLGILRLGLVQTALGAIVVLTTSTLNRVMVVEYALPAMVPGILVGVHYAIQMLRPRWGYGSDMGGARTPWIVGGVAVLGLGAVLAALATLWMGEQPLWGFAFGALAFAIIGIGVGAAGTSVLAFLATHVRPERRAPAASIVWIMMIAGMAITATIAGGFLDPFGPVRLLTVTGVVSGLALLLSLLVMVGLERQVRGSNPSAWGQNGALGMATAEEKPDFRRVLKEVWQERQARRFTLFVFLSMLAYSGQDLILEPFAGLVFGYSPGESTKLAGLQHGGVLIGMILVAVLGRIAKGTPLGSLRGWTVAGCLASAVALVGLTIAGSVGTAWPLKLNVFLLGVANGAFAVAAIGSMMALAGAGRERREGTRMGLWGAAQAIAFGLGGFLGTVAIDGTRQFIAEPAAAYGVVFAGEALLFFFSAVLAVRVGAAPTTFGAIEDADNSPRSEAAPAYQNGEAVVSGR